MSTDSVVTFQVKQLNIGNAMNIETGVFTAPVPGIYHFAFKGIKDGSTMVPLSVFLRLNGVVVASTNAPGNFLIHEPYTVSLQATLKLKVNDQVDLMKMGGAILFENGNKNRETQFVGSLLDEDLAI